MSRRDYASTTEQSKSSPTFFSSKTGPVFLCWLVARMSKRRLNSPNGICSGKPEEEKDLSHIGIKCHRVIKLWIRIQHQLRRAAISHRLPTTFRRASVTVAEYVPYSNFKTLDLKTTASLKTTSVLEGMVNWKLHRNWVVSCWREGIQYL